MTSKHLQLLDLILLLLLFWTNSVGAAPTSTSTATTGSETGASGQKCYEEGREVKCSPLKVVPAVIIFTLLGSCACRFIMERRGITIQELVAKGIERGYANAEAHANRRANANAPAPSNINNNIDTIRNNNAYPLLYSPPGITSSRGSYTPLMGGVPTNRPRSPPLPY
ncbi:5740_t:CDS:2 [Acaulospora colombiana]|uniref:5740_t:CDS:1 n=1 Tax=Acaulospora colombiana TaxID=27376 RepID=A0ACA9LVZ8_9GLOM|nr:5740_t:CDS:2 [Acaulospora colombiana]